MTHMRMVWICLALAALGIALAAAGLAWGYLLIVIPCVAMIAAMAWMVVSGSGGSDDIKRG